MPKAKMQSLPPEERLAQALVPADEQPYAVPENWVWTRLESINGYQGSSVEPSRMQNCFFELYSVPSSEYDYPEMLQGFEIGSSKQAVKKGDILLCKINPRINRVWNVSQHTKNQAVASSEWIVVRSPNIHEKYLLWCLRSVYFREFMLSNVSGVGGSLMRAQPKYVKTYPVPVAPPAEQHRIVTRIESLFEKLNRAKELVASALSSFENRKAAILHKAFTGELTAAWRKKNGVSFDSWEHTSLGETDIEIIDGDRGENYPKKEEFVEDGYCLFLNAKNVTKNGFVFDVCQFITKDKDLILRKGRLMKNDVVLTTRGTIGNVAHFNDTILFENMRINSGMVIFRAGKSLYQPYVCLLFRSGIIYNQIASIKTGSAQPQLPIKIMINLVLPVPSVPEQLEIVRILDSLLKNEKSARELSDTLGKIDLMKKSILARAFRGELGTNDPHEESAINLLEESIK
ncbi:MAG: restriction endonuclease subunit S [Defluviitaleaceae bacterium]|nr:restriction endonuclease subunit S [Defluviitaleaceae bacterium]